MKKYLILVCIGLVMAFVSCEERTIEPIDKDGEVPGTIEITSVENLPGAAKVKYNLPDDDDLLYVKATFNVDGKDFEVKSTYFQNTLILNGFNEEKPYTVSFQCVDRSNNVGAAVMHEVNPLEAPVFQIYKSLSIAPDWGGARFSWTNEYEAPVVINIIAEDMHGNINPVEWVYTSANEQFFTIRGFDPEEKTFAAVVRDRYDNYSDTIYSKITPFFEEEVVLDGNSIKVLDDDTPLNSWGGTYSRLFNDNISSYAAWDGPFPIIMTVDLGQLTTLSRIKIWNRISNDSHYYGGGNGEKWRIFGVAELPGNTGLESWNLMGEYQVKKPSGLSNTASLTQEDKEYADAGWEFLVGLDKPKVRYIRVVCDKTFGNANYLYTSGLKVFGSKSE